MRLLDLFCGAGGAAMGYYRAGFDEIVGVDIRPQKHYLFTFVLGDALEYVAAHGQEFDAIHASPPCQFASTLTEKKYRGRHPNLIPATRLLLRASGKPYVIENVGNARRHLINPVMLCGSMFGLDVWRHRFFEVHPSLLMSPSSCNHSNVPVLVSGSPRRNGSRVEPSTARRRSAMQTPWMSRVEMDQAIPPSYAEWIGTRLLGYLRTI